MKYITGDIFKLAEQGKFDYVIHGCNCQNAMGSGVARTVRDSYPKAYAADMATKKGDLSKLGHFTHAYVPAKLEMLLDDSGSGYRTSKHSFTIINAYTQAIYWENYKDGILQPNVLLDAVHSAFTGIKLMYDNNPGGVARFAIPKIGAVRGGGVWEEIEEIIDSVGIIDLTCVLYDGNVNK
jgi:O-acetyl-ADP-ribose deacetylase (regulator of RNase III)